MGRGGLNTTMGVMDMFSLDEDTGAYKNSTDESKALLNDPAEWNDEYGVEDASGHVNDEWNDLLMGMEEANDILSRPLDGPDQAASAPMLGFNRSASAPDLLGLPGAPCLSSPRPGDLSSTEPMNILRAQTCA